MTPTQQQHLINILYGSLLDSDGFHRFIHELINILGLRSCVVLISNPENNVTKAMWLEGYDMKDMPFYQEHIAPIDPLLTILRQANIGDYHSINIDELPQDDPTYRFYIDDFAKPLNAYAGGGCVLSREGGWVTLFTFQRGEGEQHLIHQDREWFNLLLPHLQNAVRLFLRLYSSQQQTEFSNLLFERLQMPVIMLDVFGSVVCATQLANQIIDASESIALQDGKLWSRRQSLLLELEHHIHKTINYCQESSQTNMVLDIGSMAQKITLVMTPIVQPESGWVRGALVFLYDNAQRNRVNKALLQRIYSLSASESLVAEGVVMGMSLEKIAEKHHLSLETVRSYLKRVYQKTGSHRQNDLTAMLLSSPAISLEYSDRIKQLQV